MKAVSFFSGKTYVLIFSLLLAYSCSKESIEDLPSDLVDNVVNMETSTSTTDYSSTTTCVGSDYGGHRTENAYVTVGNGAQYKSLTAYIQNSAEDIVVRAYYNASAENEDLKATVTINIGGVVETFSGVNPYEYVTSTYNLDPQSGGELIPIIIEQKVFLEPAVISIDYHIVPACPPVIGESRYGGIVAHIFQEGDEGYVEGETHGLVVSPENLAMNIWSAAITECINLELNGYDDWYLPSANELLVVRENIQFSSSNPYDGNYAFWSSTEENDLNALAVDEIALVNPDYFIAVYPKTTVLNVRPVRGF